ncbi:MAG: DegT/DnrJ/EryC1/StrS family aminotransferase [Nitrosopumilaceae archaeon]
MIAHNRPTLGSEEEAAALRVIRSGYLAQGKEVKSFENEFCRFIGLPESHAVALSSGSAALYLSMWVLGAQEKKVSFPAYVCSALEHAVRLVGGREDLIDVSNNSPNIDLLQLEKNKPDISIIPHMFGLPLDLTNVNVENVIEDCSQALGAKVRGKYVGLQGTLGIFSFYATKLITTGGQGGIIISKTKDLLEPIRKILDYDTKKDNFPKFNFQMTDLQAAIGREQLKKIQSFISKREEIFNRYKEAGIELLDLPISDKQNLKAVRYRALMKSHKPLKLIQDLSLKGIKAVVPMEGWFDKEKFPNSFKLTTRYVSLPIYPSLLDEDVNLIISAIKDSMRR